jgi:hypothetical protein
MVCYGLWLTGAGALRCVVHDLHLHQHVFQGHPDRPTEAHYPHDRPIRFRIRLVLDTRHVR